jgi:uncharacterized membrane protein YraQ (UPF0718 family)/copper chaperone CopZ
MDFVTTPATDFWDVLTDMAPFLLFGFLMAGILSMIVSPAFVERHLGSRGISPILKASLLGIPLPLCSCGVIPVAASLRRHGAGRGATTAFIISTPQDGIDSILVTFALLGGVFAAYRPVAALVSGMIGGLLVNAFTRKEDLQLVPRCADACCAGANGNRFFRALSYGFGTLPRDIGRELLIGLVIASLISALVPKDFFATVLGGGVLAILILMLVGIPTYVCATASVPIAAALIAKGVSPGAAFAFLMTGPATNAATIFTVYRTMGRRTTVIYLVSIALTALAGGLILDYIFHYRGTMPETGMPAMLPGWVRDLSAGILLIVLGVSIFRGRPKEEVAAVTDEEQAETLYISGMTCSHCTNAVRQALMECHGVGDAQVNLADGRAVVTGSGMDMHELRKAVESLGYSVKDASILPVGLGDTKETP